MPKNKIKYKNIPTWGDISKLSEVPDFLPKPEELVLRPKSKKVTLILDEDSILFFKEKADQLNTSYQRMIRTLLYEYSRRMRYLG